MGLHQIPEDCQDYCHSQESCVFESKCKDCIDDCSTLLKDYLTPPSDTDHGNHSKVPAYLIITFSVVASVFFALCCYAIYVKFFSPRNRARRSLPPSSRQHQEDTRDEFLDEEHGPIVDHPIWYIRTLGLHPSIINAITVCKYNKGEGLIEGTECSVCLSEFQEDESLRLLPKCNHAFHLPCIDTWLGSHTNCPMCRAPIVTNPAATTTRIPSMEPNAVVVVGSSSLEGISESLGMEENSGGGAELRNGTEEDVQVEVERGGRRVCENEVLNMQPRRSVSLDSSSAAKISAAALATVGSGSVQESHGNSMRKITGEANELVGSKRGLFGSKGSSSSSSSRTRRYLQSAPGSMKRSRSFSGKQHLMSWYGRSRSQKKPSAVVRSF